MMAPAATPPRIPAPTTYAYVFPCVIGRVPIGMWMGGKSPKPPNARQPQRNTRATLWRKLGAENFHPSQVEAFLPGKRLKHCFAWHRRPASQTQARTQAYPFHTFRHTQGGG